MHCSKYFSIFLVCFFLLSSIFLKAQEHSIDRENDYSLLWKIEGNSLKKPSYIFGTMHVRNKKAFSFSDSVLIKLLNSDVFASEYNIDTMNFLALQKGISAVEDKIIFEDYFSENEQKILNDFDKEKRIDFKLLKNKSFKELKEYFENFETIDNNLMPTYLDAYLFQIAKDNGKHVMGMETVESSYVLRDTLSKEMKKAFIHSKLDSLPYFLSSKEQMLNLYHDGNIDSIWQFYDKNPYYFKKIILDNRNVIMVDTLENIMMNYSVFMAVGAAHLSGDSGLIQLFRNKGFSVSKVKATFTGVSDSLMQTFSQRSQNWFKHIDSSKHYSLDVPYKPNGHEFLGGLIKMYISMDPLKNSAYYFYAVPTVLSGVEREEDVFKLIKTAFGEKRNIEVVSKRKISLNNTQGYEFILKNTPIFEAKARIFLFKENIYFQMVGNNAASYNSDEAKRFFESFKIWDKTPNKKESVWTKYSYDNGAFAIKLPYEPSYLKKEVPDFEGIYQNPYYIHMYTCINTKDKEFYIVRWNDLPEGYYYDSYTNIYQETFASILGADYEFDPEKEIKLDAGTFHGFETMNTVKDKSFELRVRAYIRGNRIYLLLGQYSNIIKDSKVNEFFNSFEGTPFLKSVYKSHNISGVNIALPAQPIITGDTKTGDIWYNYVPYKVYSSIDPNNGLLISVNVNEYPKYYYTKSADSLLKEIEEETFYYSKVFDTKTGCTKKGIYFRSGMKIDEDSPNKILFKYFLNGNRSYEIYIYITEELMQDSIQNQIFNSITFDSTDTTFDIFKSKTQLIFKDLLSTDSATFDMAKKALSYHPFDSADIPSLYEALSYNYLDSTKKWGSAKGKIIDAIKENHDEHAISVLRKSYSLDHGSKIPILLAISKIDSLQKKLVFNLLSELPDTSSTFFGLSTIFNYIADSSEFFKEKITELIEISRKVSDNEIIVEVINENYDVLNLDQEQVNIVADYCIELYDLGYDSLINRNSENNTQYLFIDLIGSALQFFIYDKSNNYDTYFEKASKIDNISILAKVCLYNLSRGNKVSSSLIKKVVEDPENGWNFLLEASKLNVLSRINNKLLEEENLALIHLRNSFYWDDYYVPEKTEIIETRKINIKDKEYTCYIFTFAEGSEEPYLAITGGFELINGQLLNKEVFFNYSYETYNTDSKKEEIILDLFSIYSEITLIE